MKTYLRFLLLLCLLALAAGPAQALRCGSGIVDVGDTTLDLLRTCGKPVLKERFEEPLVGRRYDPGTGSYFPYAGTSSYDVWTYNFGPSRFVQRIIIQNGRIYRIESEGYGF